MPVSLVSGKMGWLWRGETKARAVSYMYYFPLASIIWPMIFLRISAILFSVNKEWGVWAKSTGSDETWAPRPPCSCHLTPSLILIIWGDFKSKPSFVVCQEDSPDLVLEADRPWAAQKGIGMSPLFKKHTVQILDLKGTLSQLCIFTWKCRTDFGAESCGSQISLQTGILWRNFYLNLQCLTLFLHYQVSTSGIGWQ